ncbi:LOW QUALITY PROTEIN: hypothetical protein N665_0148s0028 [Sinapis alba]|nr:LOW QUALITY PROTEIN: hypothetical protein N665_0148s0028 [Sinapis alba]
MTAPEGSQSSAPPAPSDQKRDKVKSTWGNVVQNGPGLTEHVLEVKKIEGREVVTVPDSVIQDQPPLWEDLLEGRFLAPAPHNPYHRNKIWPLGNASIKIDVFEVNENTVKFRIKDEATRHRVLRRGMWNIANIPMVLSKWAPIVEEEEEQEIKIIPMWIKMKNVPHKMFSWEGLSFIASAVGKSKRLHPETILCNSFEEAKVFVEADMTKELPKSHRFKSKLGVDAEVDFIYPWLPDKCTICSKWGHLSKACKAKVKLLTRTVAVEVEGESGIAEKDEVRVGGETEAVVVESDADSISSTSGEGITFNEQTGIVVTEETGKTAECNEVSVLNVLVETANEKENAEEEEDKWLDVSPTKQGRGGSKSSSPVVVSPSRFAVLTEEESREDQTEPIGANLQIRKEKEEREIVEESTEVTEDNSEEDEPSNHKAEEQVKHGERALRSTLPRLTKTQIKQAKDTVAPKEVLPNATGKKRPSKRK